MNTLMPTRMDDPAPQAALCAGQALHEITATLDALGVTDPQRWAETMVAFVLDAPHVALNRLAKHPITPA